ncbi:MAG: LLM class flavin-dependent oxidoreductase [Chloroflexi bacterium]|nr:LLM class flavin-dependent oxidoreductase [Chloroflexota bacterium]
MRFGLWVTANFPTRHTQTHYFQGLAEQVRLAKQMGFSLISSGQHYLTAPDYRLQTLPLLARLSAEGEGMEVATSVLLLPLHNPVDVAEQAATMDVLTGGRFILGLGLGHADGEYQAFAVDKRRIVSRYEEALDVMAMLWRGGAVEHQGRYFTVPRTQSTARWVQPQPRVWLGGGGSTPIQRAARYGFAWFPGGGGSETLAQGRSLYLRALKQLGVPAPPDFPIGLYVYLCEDEGQAMEEAHRLMGGRATPEEFRQRAHTQMIVGTPEQAVQRVKEYQELGINYLLCRFQTAGMSQAQVLRTIRLLGEEVILKFQG